MEGLPLLPLKSITPFPLGSVGTGPSVWLVVKAHIIAAFMEAWSLIDRQRGSFSKQISAPLIVSSLSAGQLGAGSGA